jgi:hypothetical protein
MHCTKIRAVLFILVVFLFHSSRGRFGEIPFHDYFPSIWKLKAVIVSPLAANPSKPPGPTQYDENDNVGVVSLKTERGVEVFLKVDRTEGLEPLTLRLPSQVGSVGKPSTSR